MTRRGLPLLALILTACLSVMAQVPQRPTPPRLVNDLAGVLGGTEAMEDTLERFAHYTSNQIVVVTMNDLQGYAPQEMAYKIGQEWGVGDKRFNNGVVILIKPKTATGGGQVFIATGYGVEGVLPDAVCRRIIEQQLIPQFRQNDYASGVWSALGVIMPILKGEYSAEELLQADDELTGAEIMFFLIFMGIFLYIMYLSIKNDNNRGSGTGGRNSGTWGGPIIFGTGSGWSGGSSSSDWGGGYSGGFGGFGGGSFGGGGAGGSW